MTTITIINEGEPNNPQHIDLLGGEKEGSMKAGSVEITSEQVARNIEDSERIMDYLSGRV